MIPTLDARRSQILEAIIHCHTLTAQPVGSRVIAKRYALGLSAATIRNAMADLEEMELVMQPHTSAGRVPTELGYRYYVDSLMNMSSPNETEKSQIRRAYREVRQEFNHLMEQTSHILSTLSHYVGVVVSPALHTRILRRLEILEVSDQRFLVVLVIDPGIIRNRVLPREAAITGDDLIKINNALNARFAGRPLLEMRDLVEHPEALASIFDPQIFRKISTLVRGMIEVTADMEIYLQGASNIFTQPEFDDLQRIEAMLKVFEAKEQLSNLLVRPTDLSEGVRVRIGSEIDCEGMEQCSLISATYQWQGHPLGTLGVIGPTRMEYSRIMSLVDYTAKIMSQVLQSKLA